MVHGASCLNGQSCLGVGVTHKTNPILCEKVSVLHDGYSTRYTTGISAAVTFHFAILCYVFMYLPCDWTGVTPLFKPITFHSDSD